VASQCGILLNRRFELTRWPDDDLRWIDPVKVADIVSVISEILGFLRQKPADWTRKG